MDARPNVLNKILPCTKIFPLYSNRYTGAVWSGGGLVGWKLDDSGAEYVMYHGIVPYDMKAGSNLTFRVDCTHMTQNDSGSTKHTKINTKYDFGRAGSRFTGMTTGTVTLIPVADGVLIYTLQQIDIQIISGVVAGDAIGLELKRDGTHADDTLVGDFWLAIPLKCIYTADKIGVI